MSNDKISSKDELSSKLGERMMSEMVTVLMDYHALKDRVEKLESAKSEQRQEQTNAKAQRTANRSLVISVVIGITQILLILYQIFGR